MESEQNYWLITPGRTWETWNLWHEKGFMAYAWSNRIGNFESYSSPEDIQNALLQYNLDHPEAKQGASTYEHVSKQIWMFVHEMQIGDIVFVKGKDNKIVGRGRVDSGHKYCPDSEYDDGYGYANIRMVTWAPKIEANYPADNNQSHHALLNITNWPEDFLVKLDNLFDAAEQNNQLTEEVKRYNLEGKTRAAYVKVRENQGVFRERMLRKYPHCCLCEIDQPAFLIASHIKPWSDSSPIEQLDENNGLLLCPNHDALFDKGFISFDDNGQILISKKLAVKDMERLSINPDMRVDLSDENKGYMAYHREKFSNNLS